MEADQLETTEFKTIIVIYSRQIRAKTTSVAITRLIVPNLPPLTKPTTGKRKTSQEAQGRMSQQIKLASGQQSFFFLGNPWGRMQQSSKQSRASEHYPAGCEAARSLLAHYSHSQMCTFTACLCSLPEVFKEKGECLQSNESCRPFHKILRLYWGY